jgi:uncharacterized protein (TIGR02246 family)
MKRSFTGIKLSVALAALTLYAFTVSAQESVVTNSRAEDEAAIRENVRLMEAGWNAKSGSLLARPFAADADFVNLLGTHIKGRTEIEKSHQEIFDTVFKNSTVKLFVKQIRFLRPDVAVVHAGGQARMQQGEETREWEGRAMLVMTKEKGEWKIVSFQNTQVGKQQRR